MLLRRVMFCFENYSRPPLRKNQEKKKKKQLNDDKRTPEARLHADARQELWNVKEGVCLPLRFNYLPACFQSQEDS